MQLLGARIAMSGGGGSSLLSAVKDVPGLGLLAGGYDEGYNAFQSLYYQPGRYYQQIEGGSVASNQVERVNQAKYQLGNLFTPMGPSAAGEAFNAVTALGYNNSAGAAQTQFGGAGTEGQNRPGVTATGDLP